MDEQAALRRARDRGDARRRREGGPGARTGRAGGGVLARRCDAARGDRAARPRRPLDRRSGQRARSRPAETRRTRERGRPRARLRRGPRAGRSAAWASGGGLRHGGAGAGAPRLRADPGARRAVLRRARGRRRARRPRVVAAARPPRGARPADLGGARRPLAAPRGGDDRGRLGPTTSRARRALPALAGRDAAALDADGVARAVVESVAENTSDAVVGTLFWGAVGGPAGVAAYRAANTLDAMVGHRYAALRAIRLGVGTARRRAQLPRRARGRGADGALRAAPARRWRPAPRRRRAPEPERRPHGGRLRRRSAPAPRRRAVLRRRRRAAPVARRRARAGRGRHRARVPAVPSRRRRGAGGGDREVRLS